MSNHHFMTLSSGSFMFCIGMGTFIGTDRIHVKSNGTMLPKHIIVTLREWKSGRFSMPDMNTALHAPERNDVSSRGQSKSDRKRWKVRLHFSKCDADYVPCNISDVKYKTSGGKTSNLRSSW
ncbi:hypothetical protein ATANTOWER_009456 [Ataeniobius toweri]|uniref:Uncharacterized protein n=1 Tax=Ataeniobius toweri TaxID=208326 RepID=A0ABU7B8D1_9TELE|nr:hypothetical protein [Ataeniobius toweri]